MKAHLDVQDLLASAGRGLTIHERKKATWSIDEFSGCLLELFGADASAALTLCFSLVLDAQNAGEPVAWITSSKTCFFPPDVADRGVDLNALVVVRVPESNLVTRAADPLVRSGAFGLVVIDLFDGRSIPMPLQTRLMGLANRHHSVLLFLRQPGMDRTPLGSLVLVRIEARRHPIGEDRFLCEARIVKDKRRGPGWRYTEVCRGPAGLH